MAFPLNQIVFPTDFSKNAHEALSFAAEIACQADAELILFHSSQATMDLAPDFENSREQTIEDTSHRFDELISFLQKDERYAGIDISTMLQTGQPSTSLLNLIVEDKPDLVVMGTQGETDNQNVIFGTVTTNIIQKSEVPVLAVPKGCKPDFKNIIFTTDYKPGDITALEQTIDFADLFDSTVDALHITQKKDFESELKFRGFRELAASHIPHRKVDFHIRYEDDFFPGVVNYINGHPASLLVMVRYARTFWERLTDRNHSKEMAFYSDVPLLVLIDGQKPFKSTLSEQSSEYNT